MSNELVMRIDTGGLATLTLNRPDKLNALTPQVFVQLRAHIDAIAQDKTVRCVVLAGNGRSFCAGHDLPAIAAGEHGPSPDFEAETIDALEALPQPGEIFAALGIFRLWAEPCFGKEVGEIEDDG